MFVGIQFLRLGVILGLIYYSVSCILWAKIQKKVRIREAAQVCLNSLNQRFFLNSMSAIELFRYCLTLLLIDRKMELAIL